MFRQGKRGRFAGVALLLVSISPAGNSAADRIPPSGRQCGSAWTFVPSPNQGTESNYLTGVAAISDTDAWAVGYSDSPTSGHDPLTMHWDGISWTVVPTPAGGPLNGVAAVSSDDVWAVGNDSIRHWDGVQWTVVLPTGEHLLAVDPLSSSDAWAVGYSLQSAAEHWDGTTWSIIPTPPIGSSSILWGVQAADATDVWAVGGYVDNSNVNRTLTMHWDGIAWSIVPSPSPPPAIANLLAVAVAASDDVWAVGSAAVGSNSRHLSEHWNGTSWTSIPTAIIRTRVNNALNGVVALSTNDVWTVGSAGTGPKTLTEHWNGVGWTVVPSPSPGGKYGNYLRALAADDAGTHLWAVGYSRSAFGSPFTSLVEEVCPA
jgi:hypothetical protein